MRKALALVAHDARKDDLVELVKMYKDELTEVDLVATRGTGQLIQKRVGLPVTLLQSELLGGDQQIGALIAGEEVNAVIFLRDSVTAHPDEPDVSALLRVCDVHDVPLATSLATAKAVLHVLGEHSEAWREHQAVARSVEEIVA
jgi:methylglyoxal synthase